VETKHTVHRRYEVTLQTDEVELTEEQKNLACFAAVVKADGGDLMGFIDAEDVENEVDDTAADWPYWPRSLVVAYRATEVDGFVEIAGRDHVGIVFTRAEWELIAIAIQSCIDDTDGFVKGNPQHPEDADMIAQTLIRSEHIMARLERDGITA
jgi:hypothetical protein